MLSQPAHVGPIARETARRIACDCSLSINEVHKTNNSEPINIGRKSRIWPNAMARAIKERDQHCAWPGCTHSHHLHIHHITHWADGGETSVHNGVCLCSYHHTQVHEGGYTIEHVEENTQRHHQQFIQQQHNDDTNLFDFEKSLRNDRDSFNTVRKLSPTRYQYQIIDSHGRVISGRSSGDSEVDYQNDSIQSTNHFRYNSYVEDVDSTHVDNIDSIPADSFGSTCADNSDDRCAETDQPATTRCSEAIPETYFHGITNNHALALIPDGSFGSLHLGRAPNRRINSKVKSAAAGHITHR